MSPVDRRPPPPTPHPTTTPTKEQQMTDQPDLDDRLCTAEFPGDDTFVGQLCEREHGHDGDHEHLAVIEGTRYTRHLTWS